MQTRAFDTIEFDDGLDYTRFDRNLSEDVQEFLRNHMRFRVSDKTSAENLTFKFKAYKPNTFTFKLYDKNDAANPFIFFRFAPFVFFDDDMNKHIRLIERMEKDSYASPGQRMRDDRERNEIHNRMAAKLRGLLNDMGIAIEDADENEIQRHMRMFVSVIEAFDPTLGFQLEASSGTLFQNRAFGRHEGWEPS
ncbi:MAG: hypothetical protein AB7E85_00990 [Pseudobdellovibrionaceae bacterium]